MCSTTANPGVTHTGHSETSLAARSSAARRIISMRVGLACARRSVSTNTRPLRRLLLRAQWNAAPAPSIVDALADRCCPASVRANHDMVRRKRQSLRKCMRRRSTRVANRCAKAALPCASPTTSICAPRRSTRAAPVPRKQSGDRIRHRSCLHSPSPSGKPDRLHADSRLAACRVELRALARDLAGERAQPIGVVAAHPLHPAASARAQHRTQRSAPCRAGSAARHACRRSSMCRAGERVVPRAR